MDPELLKMGLPGIVIAGLTTAVVAQYRENKRLNRERLSDQKEAAKSLRESNGALRAALDALLRQKKSLPPPSSDRG